MNFRPFSLSAVAVISMLGMSINVSAETETETTNTTSTATPETIAPAKVNFGRFGVFLESFSIEKQLAKDEGVGSSAWSFGGEYVYQFQRYFTVGGGVALLFLSDKRKFTQTVEGTGLLNDGDIESKDSGIDAGSLYTELGFLYPLTQSNKVQAGINVGYRYFDIDRTIENCTNCREENIDLDSGTYVEPNLLFAVNEKLGINVAYSKYSGDETFSDSILLSLTIKHQ